MTWIIEIILGLAILIASNFFWSALGAIPFQRKLLQNAVELSKIFTFIGQDKLKSEGEVVEPVFGSYSNNIAFFLSAGIKAMDKTRNISAILNVLLLTAGFIILNKWFGVFNLALFLFVKFAGVHNYIKNTIITDIHSVILNIYKWNKVDHRACEQFCTKEKPYLRVLYKAVVDNL